MTITGEPGSDAPITGATGSDEISAGSDVKEATVLGLLSPGVLASGVLLSGVLAALGTGLGNTGGSDGMAGLELGLGNMTGSLGGSFLVLGVPFTVPGGGAATGATAVALVSAAAGARAVSFTVAVESAGVFLSAVCCRRLVALKTCSMRGPVTTQGVLICDTWFRNCSYFWRLSTPPQLGRNRSNTRKRCDKNAAKCAVVLDTGDTASENTGHIRAHLCSANLKEDILLAICLLGYRRHAGSRWTQLAIQGTRQSRTGKRC